MRLLFAFLVGIGVAWLDPCAPGLLAQSADLVRERIAIPFVQAGREPLFLEGILTRPAQPGAHPLLIISHGSPRNAADRPKLSAGWAAGNANQFGRRGWATAVFLRRGYEHSEGTFSESYGSYQHASYEAAGIATDQDIVQAAAFLQLQPYVDPSHVLLVGVSAGGFGSIAAASLSPPGVVGVVNFAGGRGSGSPDQVCSKDALVRAYGSYGKTARVPSLWIYAENDHFFGPSLAREMFAAFISAGAPGELIIAPPFGQDGHNLFKAPEQWRASPKIFCGSFRPTRQLGPLRLRQTRYGNSGARNSWLFTPR